MAKFKTEKTGKSKIGIIFAVLLVLLIIACGLLYYTVGLGAVDRNDDTPVTVDVPSGSGASSIVYILDDAGLVRSPLSAKVNARIGGYNSLQANTYVFNKTMTFKEMMTAINEGNFDYVAKNSINVIAGDRLEQIAENIASETDFTAKELLAKWSDETYLKELIDKYWFLTDEILDKDIIYPLEGYFYADTYYLTSATGTIEELTTMFLDRMDTELTARKSEIEKSGFTVHQFLTLTSIVTKEGGDTEEELPTVAGVFINRLNDGMSLGSDVTVNYIYQQDLVNIKQSQLENDSPYNTRIHAGLPPGPIASVLDSRMDAVLHYKKTDYLFFYGCPDGRVIFSKTVEEHDKAAAENPWPEDM